MIANKIINTEYIHHINNIGYLKRIGFNWNNYYKGFVYRFPVYKDGYRTTLECLFIIYMDDDYENKQFNKIKLLNKVQVEVVDPNHDGYYAPFYSYNNGYKDFIEKINKKILRKMKRLNITEKGR